MPDPSSEQHIRSLHPALRPWVRWFVDFLRAAGVPVVVISGRRSVEHNERVGGAPNSWHLDGLAFDLWIPGRRVSDDPDLWSEIGQVWESLGGRWGGRFTRPDPNHFDVG